MTLPFHIFVEIIIGRDPGCGMFRVEGGTVGLRLEATHLGVCEKLKRFGVVDLHHLQNAIVQ